VYDEDEIDDIGGFMTHWIIPCNPNYFDIIGLFHNQRLLNYNQTTDVNVGDVVYLYVGRPYSEILFECRVLEVNMPTCYIDDKQFVLDGKTYENTGRYMTLVLERKFESHELTLATLRSKGIEGSFQGPQRVSESLT
jgi:5-methylcytosine-specific restriction protein A